MKLFAKEEKVGLLVIIALVSLAYLTIKTGNLSLGKKKGTVLYASFANVRGLDRGAQVRVAGIEAGRVEDIVLNDNGVPRLTLLVFPEIKVRQDAVASIKSQGFMGEKYVELSPGTPGLPYAKSEGYIRSNEADYELEQVAQQVSELAKELKKITEAISETIATPEGKLAMKQTLANLQAITTQFRTLLEQNTQQISATVNNFQQLSSNLNQVVTKNEARISQIIQDLQSFAKVLRQESPGMAKQFQSTAKSLDDVITENRDALHQGVVNANQLVLKLQGATKNLNDILATVNEGKGTIGKLVKDDTLYHDAQETLAGIKTTLTKAEDFRLYLGYRGEYLTRFDKSKSYVSLKLQPRADKYYLLEIIDDFRGNTTNKETTTYTDSNGPVTTHEEITEDRFKFSAEVAKRFQDVVLRGGVIESTGGVGMDFFTLHDDLQWHVDAWDFTADNPHLKIGADYHFAKYFSVNTGVDHLIDNDSLSFFLGAGFTFEDKDLKYLLGKIPIPGL
jgi:phospholipid/cholesterol/gamma-HCH transport system substrate-binding protein